MVKLILITPKNKPALFKNDQRVSLSFSFTILHTQILSYVFLHGVFLLFISLKINGKKNRQEGGS